MFMCGPYMCAMNCFEMGNIYWYAWEVTSSRQGFLFYYEHEKKDKRTRMPIMLECLVMIAFTRQNKHSPKCFVTLKSSSSSHP